MCIFLGIYCRCCLRWEIMVTSCMSPFCELQLWSCFSTHFLSFGGWYHQYIISITTRHGTPNANMDQATVTPWNQFAFRVTGPSSGESSGHWWFLLTKGLWCGALMFPLMSSWTNCRTNSREAGGLKCLDAHFTSLNWPDVVWSKTQTAIAPRWWWAFKYGILWTFRRLKVM